MRALARTAALVAALLVFVPPGRCDPRSSDEELERGALAVLAANRKTTQENGRTFTYTCPDARKYPYQWLWDSCFHATGLRWHDPALAKAEMESLVAAQWDNGMVPNLVHLNGGGFAPRLARAMHRAGRNSSGITQPPIMAEMVERIDRTSPDPAFVRRMFPALARYHDWLARERDTEGEGLPAIFHPWESGADDSPRWDPLLGIQQFSRWRYNIRKFRLLLSFAKVGFDGRKVGDDAPYVVRGIDMACYQLVNLQAMARLAVRAGAPEAAGDYLARAEATRRAILGRMWNPRIGMFADLLGPDEKLSNVRSPFGLLPLYAGIVDQATAERLAAAIEDPRLFGTRYPLPSVAVSEPSFDPRAYWRGTSWVNVNWFLIQGLRRYGLHAQADRLTARTLDMVRVGGFKEYFDPHTGEGFGAAQYSWTASLVLDLLATRRAGSVPATRLQASDAGTQPGRSPWPRSPQHRMAASTPTQGP